ncbi:ABC transporter [Guyparkeria halophila]|uniref:ABC transporter n=1 Tax=Guyparkeria halophila TaxID=47960 RepID=A0A6I6CW40_9GAMM|nr:ABC transporter [Guyparkeria halophila]QGT77500.1 ABC transporter [Guyparkeria halophila]
MTELFGLPFLTGLALAVLLPIAGVWLRLREEWLAALAVAHLAGAGAVIALALSLPSLPGALIAAMLGMLGRHIPGAGNSAYGWLILAGWTITLLIAANSPLGETLARQVIEGQLYFTGPLELGAAVVLLGLTLALRRRIDRLELATRLLPPADAAERSRRRRLALITDLLLAALLAAGTLSIGLMATFALVLLPAWAAFRCATDWRQASRLAVGIGVIGYLAAFALALMFDQPFAAVLVATLLVSASAVRQLAPRGR